MRYYSISLSNGQNWKITAIGGAESWLDEFASIMQLKKKKEKSKNLLIFSRKSFCKSSNLTHDLFDNTLSENNWKKQDLRRINIYYRDGEPCIFCELGKDESSIEEFSKMQLALYPIFDQAQALGGLPLHAALVEKGGKAIVIAAPGGTGKSTCCKRIPSPWLALCDDETLIVKNECGVYQAHPFPTWSEYIFNRSTKKWNVEQCIPLAGIFFLFQSPIDGVESIGQGKASTLIYKSAYQALHYRWRHPDADSADIAKRRAFNNACEIARSVPAFRLNASLNGCFWEQIDEAIGTKKW